jgi:hypothetical protein
LEDLRRRLESMRAIVVGYCESRKEGEGEGGLCCALVETALQLFPHHTIFKGHKTEP